MPSRATARRFVAPSLAVAVVVAFGLAGCSDESTENSKRSEAATAATTTTTLLGAVTPMSDVVAGQCFNLVPDPDQQPFAVLLIDCADPHTYEAFAAEKYATGSTGANAPYPGALIVANNSENQCFSKFAAFMGIQWEASDYDIQAWWPSSTSWTTQRDRTVLCAVYRVTGEPTKGSVAGTKQ